ncbi:MAG: thymidine kinase [Alphaproteobacteria bacterium]|nr:thymidine kinase [Alphaproteobacteria bacterium]
MMPHPYPQGAGWIEVIAGCMFSGKTEELLRRIRRAQIARQRVIVFKPTVDVRYAVDEVVTHGDARVACVPVAHAADIARLVGEADVIGIDEAQFFDGALTGICDKLADEGRRVVVAGLDQDYRGVPFEPMPELLAIAEYITKTLAVCTVCGAPASRTQRLVARETRVLLGATDTYEARCRRHWDPERFDAEQEDLPLAGGSR